MFYHVLLLQAILDARNLCRCVGAGRLLPLFKNLLPLPPKNLLVYCIIRPSFASTSPLHPAHLSTFRALTACPYLYHLPYLRLHPFARPAFSHLTAFLPLLPSLPFPLSQVYSFSLTRLLIFLLVDNVLAEEFHAMEVLCM